MDGVSETTRLNWKEIYLLPVEEFLTYCVYVHEKNRRQEEAINKIKNKRTY